MLLFLKSVLFVLFTLHYGNWNWSFIFGPYCSCMEGCLPDNSVRDNFGTEWADLASAPNCVLLKKRKFSLVKVWSTLSDYKPPSWGKAPGGSWCIAGGCWECCPRLCLKLEWCRKCWWWEDWRSLPGCPEMTPPAVVGGCKLIEGPADDIEDCSCERLYDIRWRSLV